MYFLSRQILIPEMDELTNSSEVTSDEKAKYHVEVPTQTSSNDVISRNNEVPAVVIDGDNDVISRNDEVPAVVIDGDNDVISRNNEVPAVVINDDFLEKFTTQLVVTDVPDTSCGSESEDFIEMEQFIDSQFDFLDVLY